MKGLVSEDMSSPYRVGNVLTTIIMANLHTFVNLPMLVSSHRMRAKLCYNKTISR